MSTSRRLERTVASPSGRATSLGMPSTAQPAASALVIPVGESSIATHRAGSTPSATAAAR